MGKVIQDFGVATLYEVRPAREEIVAEWDPWRKDYQGMTGWLRLYESEKKYPGKRWLYFLGGDDPVYCRYLKTYYGEMTLEGKVLTFLTENSCYVFRLRNEPDVSEEELSHE